MKAKVLALYLPQFHPTPDNNKWWGEGFTEWTNVAKAQKLYRSHYQPHIPADLGFYDLRLPEVREMQAEYAKRAGVSAFCYYHYWFGDGKQELEKPFEEVVASGSPDFPFCLCWANHDWSMKTWNRDGSSNNRVLCKMKYFGYQDNEMHFYSLLGAFLDKRYVTYKGRILFMIWDPLGFINFEEFKNQWNNLAVQNGLLGFHFVAQCLNPQTPNDISKLVEMGYDAVNVLHLGNFQYETNNIIGRVINHISHHWMNRPFINDYSKILNQLVGEEASLSYVYPSLVPNWDHTPRSGRGGYLFENAEPELFEKHCRMVFDEIKDKPEEDRIVFLKSWNEWGEGNYMEPDLRFGCGYIDALKRALTD